VKLLAHLDELRELQFFHHFQRDVVARDHVHLSGDVRRQKRHGHQCTGYRIRALRVDYQRNGCHIARRQQKAHRQAPGDRDHQHAEYQPAARAKNAERLSQFHGPA
jgi:hypothetical protein